jgi:AhpD family alkylhydroperoxidase
MTTALEQIEWETCLLQPRPDPELERYVRKTLGPAPQPTRYFSVCPWVVRANVAFVAAQAALVHIDTDLMELIGLVVSRENSCRYCYAASRAILSVLGYSKARMQRIEENFLTADLSRRDQLALDFARRISSAHPLPKPADRAPLLEAGWSPGAVNEIAFSSVAIGFLNRLATLAALPTAMLEALPGRWYIRAAQPLLEWLYRRRRAGGRPETLAPELRAGPFADFVVALDGLPAARMLRTTLDDAWRSGVLSPRAKALVFAVVARGLNCPVSEREARALLAREGLDDGVTDEILATLASPRLDPIEAAVVPFARETIWYQPAQLQRRARALAATLSAEQFVELIGLAALANSVCRLAVVLDQPRWDSASR